MKGDTILKGSEVRLLELPRMVRMVAFKVFSGFSL